ncbi:MAG: hypothetical protein ACOC2Y_06380 [Spirochaetota bacterium]
MKRTTRHLVTLALLFASIGVPVLAQTGAANAEPGEEVRVPSPAADEADPALYAVGALGASSLYTTYFLLGTLADGYATAAYTASFADELARDVIGLCESDVEVLQRLLADGDLAAEDRTLVADMVRAHQLLINQAWGLIAYIEDPDDTDDWFEYRRATWSQITELLGIE